MMTIRELNRNDLYVSACIAVQAFGGNITGEDLNEPEYNMLGCFDDDNRLMAQLEINSMRNNFCGKDLSCAAIGGVACSPEHRHKGAVKKIFNEFFTGNTSYESAGMCISFETEFENFCAVPYSDSVTVADKDNFEILKELYDRLAPQYNLSFQRETDKYFNVEPFFTNDFTYMWHNESGEYKAYASFSIQRENYLIDVSEIMFEDKEALLGILGYLRQFSANLRYIRFNKLPQNTPLLKLLADEGHLKSSTSVIGSVRVLNFMNVLSKLSFDADAKFTVQINDTIPCNNGTFDLKFEGGFFSATESITEPDFVMDAPAMSKIFLTGISEYEADYLSGFEIRYRNALPAFLSVFKPRQTFFNDGF